jgi:hypothetical protein
MNSVKNGEQTDLTLDSHGQIMGLKAVTQRELIPLHTINKAKSPPLKSYTLEVSFEYDYNRNETAVAFSAQVRGRLPRGCHTPSR